MLFIRDIIISYCPDSDVKQVIDIMFKSKTNFCFNTDSWMCWKLPQRSVVPPGTILKQYIEQNLSILKQKTKNIRNVVRQPNYKYGI